MNEFDQMIECMLATMELGMYLQAGGRLH